MSVQFLRSMGEKGVTKIVKQTLPKGTSITTSTSYGRNLSSQFVAKSKEVILPKTNYLRDKGVAGFRLSITEGGEKVLKAINESGETIANGFEEVRTLIKAIKQFGLKL